MQLAGWCAIAVVVSMVFMGATYAVLPTSATARHYLTTAPMIGFILVSVRKSECSLTSSMLLTVQPRLHILSHLHVLQINAMILLPRMTTAPMQCVLLRVHF